MSTDIFKIRLVLQQIVIGLIKAYNNCFPKDGTRNAAIDEKLCDYLYCRMAFCSTFIEQHGVRPIQRDAAGIIFRIDDYFQLCSYHFGFIYHVRPGTISAAERTVLGVATLF